MNTIKQLKNSIRKAIQPMRRMGRIGLYYLRGCQPWTKGYREYKWRTILKYITSGKKISLFSSQESLAEKYGVGIDERIIEYPWVFSHIGKGPGSLLDVGSTLNHTSLLKLPILFEKQITILNIIAEEDEFKDMGVSYVIADIRDIPIADNTFDTVTCISTLEHVGMDNDLIYKGGDEFMEKKENDYLKAIKELLRVVKPSGKVLITVPYGRYEDHGFFQQFDEVMVQKIISQYKHSVVDYYRYSVSGWQKEKDLTLMSESSYFDVHTQKKASTRRLAAAEAVACIMLQK